MIIKVDDYTGRQFRVGGPMPDYPNLTVTSIELSMNGGAPAAYAEAPHRPKFICGDMIRHA